MNDNFHAGYLRGYMQKEAFDFGALGQQAADWWGKRSAGEKAALVGGGGALVGGGVGALFGGRKGALMGAGLGVMPGLGMYLKHYLDQRAGAARDADVTAIGKNMQSDIAAGGRDADVTAMGKNMQNDMAAGNRAAEIADFRNQHGPTVMPPHAGNKGLPTIQQQAKTVAGGPDKPEMDTTPAPEGGVMPHVDGPGVNKANLELAKRLSTAQGASTGMARDQSELARGQAAQDAARGALGAAANKARNDDKALVASAESPLVHDLKQGARRIAKAPALTNNAAANAMLAVDQTAGKVGADVYRKALAVLDGDSRAGLPDSDPRKAQLFRERAMLQKAQRDAVAALGTEE